MFLIENGILKRYENDDNRTDVVIPEGVTAIDKEAFKKAPEIRSVTIPDAITKIGEGAFYNCNKLVSVTLPQGLTHIGKNAFFGCGQISSLKLPDGLEVIGEDAFENCENLKEINIPPSVKKIGMSAFAQCIRMTSVTLPESIDSIPIGMFFNCNSLEKIKLPDNITSIGNSAFGFSNLREVTIPKSVRKIGKNTFSRCSNLRRVTFLRNDTEIMLNVFIGCTDLVTNLPIKQWKTDYGFFKLTYAMYYMRQYTPGDPFFENVKEENKAYIKGQLKKLLKNIVYYRKSADHGSDAHDTNMVVFLTREKMLDIDEVDLLLEEMAGNPEASALLLDYRARNFSEKILEKYETDKLNKELGLKERTAADWKQIYRLGDDGNGGYKILGYKGGEVNVEIPAKIGKKPVTAIGDHAFSGEAPHITHAIRDIRRSLETVIIPDSVTFVGIKVFSFCNKLNCIIYRGKEFTPDEFEDYFHPQDPDKT